MELMSSNPVIPDGYGIYGLTGAWSPRARSGIDKIAKALREEGFVITTTTWARWKQVLDFEWSLLMKGTREKLGKPLKIFGHSQGVQSAARIARVVPVDYLGAIDPTLDQIPQIGRNVKRVDEFHATTDFVEAFRRLSKEQRGALLFSPAFTGTKTLTQVPGGHIHCANADITRDTIVASFKQ